MSDSRFPCPCCGHLVFAEAPGSDDICLVCFWEDDLGQLRWPHLEEGANAPSLADAQRNVAKLGAIEERFVGDVRKPLPEETRDPEWRPIAESDSFEEPDQSAAWPDDATALYYWRPTFWRRAKK
jgi:hypothetical protein